MVSKAGDIIISRLNLITAHNVKIDISRIFGDIQLNEDLFSNTLKGIISLNDHLDLLSSIPANGCTCGFQRNDHRSVFAGKPPDISPHFRPHRRKWL